VIFKTEFRPGWGEVDEDRVLHFPVVFRYFKETEARFYRSLGLPRGRLLNELSIWMPRVETYCHFRRPIRYDETLEMGMTVGELGDKTITYRYLLAGQADQQVLAEGYLTILIVSAKEFRPMPIPARLQSLLAPYVQ
jgi:YbgC/YbaW family acyl-CoA thioester hydrolase